MKKDPNDIKDDEIRIIGQTYSSSESDEKQDIDSDKHGKRKHIRKKIRIVAALGIVLLASFIVIQSLFISSPDTDNDSDPSAYDPWIKAKDYHLPSTSLNNAEVLTVFETASHVIDKLMASQSTDTVSISQITDTTVCGVEIQDTTINDVPLRIYIPHGASPELHIGLPDPEDPTIIYATQAADVRRDNGKIVGTFVLRGEPVAGGKSKAGFCAIIDNTITLGAANSTPYFEKATENGGDFFRQYSIVHEGRPVENNPKNKTIRRALCEKSDEIFIVESLSNESFHDFTQAVADLGVQEAIGLVGGSAHGWIVDTDKQKTTFGTPMKNNRYAINYILWKTKSDTP